MSIAKAIQEKRLHARPPREPQEMTSELIDVGMDEDLLPIGDEPVEDPKEKRRKQIARVIATVNAKNFR